MQQNEDRDAGNNFLYPDHTLFEVNLEDATLTELLRTTWAPDSQAIGFNPVDGLLYHTGGAESWTDNPQRSGNDQGGPEVLGVGYQDSQYMEAINLSTEVATPVFNANPCPNPDPTLPCFGLVAPRPAWVLPEERRDSTQTASSFRERGENEYHAARDLAWSSSSNLFYLADENGIFTMTPEGESTFLAQPAFPIDFTTDQMKGMTFVKRTALLVGHRSGSGEIGYMLELDPATGEVWDEIALPYPEGGGEPFFGFGGLLGLAQHPGTGVLYGVRKTTSPFARELVTINPASGAAKVVGIMWMHVASIAFVQTGGASEPWRLIAITGMQQDETRDAQNNFIFPDHTLFEVNLEDATLTELLRTTWVPDSQAIGFNPVDGLLYHTGGAESWTDNPERVGNDQGGPPVLGTGYQDNQYMEKIDLITELATAVFNANPCPNPDPALPCFGLAAPRPAWVLPEERRDSTQIASSFRERGENEYHAARDLAWSTKSNLFYLADENGIFTMTPEGESTFLAQPAFPIDFSTDQAKGIAFVTTTNLFVGHRNGFGDVGYMLELDPATGEVLREIQLQYPEGGAEPFSGFGGLLGLAQHPETGVLYGVRKTSDPFARELVTINPANGATTLVGTMGMHIASIAFVGSTAEPPVIESIAATDELTLVLTWSGGNGPFLIQKKSDLNDPEWMDVTTTDERTAVLPRDGQAGFFRIQDNASN